MSLLRFLGLGGPEADAHEPDAILAISRALEDLPETEARFCAAFAYLLARVAHADLAVGGQERTEIRERLATIAELPEATLDVVATIATGQVSDFGGTQNYLVARTFRDLATHEQCLELVGCLYAVAAADDLITTDEDNEIAKIGEELGMHRPDVVALRARFKDRFGALKRLPGER